MMASLEREACRRRSAALENACLEETLLRATRVIAMRARAVADLLVGRSAHAMAKQERVTEAGGFEIAARGHRGRQRSVPHRTRPRGVAGTLTFIGAKPSSRLRDREVAIVALASAIRF
jgi:hypothetical protein